MATRPLRYQEILDLESALAGTGNQSVLENILFFFSRLDATWTQDFVQVGGSLDLPANPVALLTWGERQRPLFAFAGADGTLLVGGIVEDQIKIWGKPLRMSCDERHDEILCLFRHRPRLDPHDQLYVAVRRWSAGGKSPEPRLYRALLRGPKQGSFDEWQCEAGRDGAQKDAKGEWPPLAFKPTALPKWLDICSLVAPTGHDLLRDPPQEMQTLRDALPEKAGPPVCALWTGTRMLWGCDQDFLVCAADRSASDGQPIHQMLALGACPRSLAAISTPGSSDVRVLVGCHDQRLRGMQLAGPHLSEPFECEFSVPAPIQAVALLPASGSQWPDVLVAMHPAELVRMRYCGRQRIHDLWTLTVQHLRTANNLDTPQAWLKWADLRLQEPLDEDSLWGLSLLLAEEALAQSPISPEDIRSLATFLQRLAFARVWSELGGHLGRRVRQFGENRPPASQVVAPEPVPDWLPELAAEIYRQTGSEVREPLDEALQPLDSRLSQNATPASTAVAFLRQRSAFNRWDVLSGRTRDVIENSHEDEPFEKHRLRVQVDFATEKYLLETHGLLPAPLRGMALVGQSDQTRLAVIGRHRLFLLPFVDQRLAARDNGQELSGGPVLRHIRALPLHAGSAGAIVGAQNSTAVLLDPQGHREEIHGPARTACRASVNLGICKDETISFALGWVEGRRSFLEVYKARPCDGNYSLQRVFIEPLTTSTVGDLDALPMGDGDRFWLGVGDPFHQEAVLFQLDVGAAKLIELERFPFGVGVTSLRFDLIGSKPRLLVGTRDGMLWCVDITTGHVVWVYRVRRVVRGIDVFSEALPGDPRVAVVADPDDLVLLDADGRRVWRRRIGRAVRSVRFLPGPLQSERLALACVDGLVTILRRCVSNEDAIRACAAEADALQSQRVVSSGRDQAALEIIDALRLEPMSFVPKFKNLQSRRARQIACWTAMAKISDPNTREDFVQQVTQRELGLIAASLPVRSHQGWAEPLLQAIRKHTEVRGSGDDSRRAQQVAAAEILRRLEWRSPDVHDLRQRLELLPEAVWTDRWVQIEAGRAWVRAANPSAGEGVAEIDSLMDALHHLEPAVAAVLHLLVRPRPVGDVLAELGRLALRASADLPVTAPALIALKDRIAQLDPPGVMGTALLRALRVVTASADGPDERWAALLSLLDACLAIPRNTTGPFAFMHKQLAKRIGDELPQDSWPLARQIAWVRSQLEQTSALGADNEPDLSGWERLVWSWSRQVDEWRRETLRQRLTWLETLTRPLLRLVDAVRITRDRLRIDLRVEPEGLRPLDDVEILIQSTDPGQFKIMDEDPCVRIQRQTFHEGEPPESLRIEGLCEQRSNEVALRVSTKSRNQPLHEMVWVFPVPVRLGETALAHRPYPAGIPSALRRIVRDVSQIDSGIGIVLADEILDPAALVAAMEERGRTRVAPLDHDLRDFGIGRRYPEWLTTETVVCALLRRDPFADTAGRLANLNEQTGPAQVLVYPAADTLNRLLHPKHGSAWQGFIELLRAHAKARNRPAFIFVLPGDSGARLRRALETEVNTVYAHRLWVTGGGSPATARKARRNLGKTTTQEEQEAIAWLKASFGLDQDSAVAFLYKSRGDLRPLLTWGQRRIASGLNLTVAFHPEDLTPWVKADVSGMTPQDLLALVILTRAQTDLPLKELKPGMESMTDVFSVTSVSGSPSKHLTWPGQILDKTTIIGRLNSRRPPLQTLRVRGWSSAGLAVWEENQKELVHFVGDLARAAQRLASLGVGQWVGKIFRVDPFLESAVDAFLKRSGDLESILVKLVDGRPLMERVELARLVALSAVWCKRLSATDCAKALPVLQAVGRLWSASQPNAAPSLSDCNILARGMSGLAVHGYREIDSYPESVRALMKLIDSNGCTFVGLESLPVPLGFRCLLGVCNPTSAPDFGLIADWLDIYKSADALPPSPMLIFLGPGVETWPDPPRERGVVVLRERELRAILRDEDIARAFWAAVRVQIGLAHLSPFVSVRSLSPGHPMFVGRRAILEEVRNHIHEKDYLIVGARRIGKTSLLQRIRNDAAERSNLFPLYLDCQGRARGSDLNHDVCDLLSGQGTPIVQASTLDLIKNLVKKVHAQGRLPIFLLNEIDGLLENDSSFVQALRGLAESELRARFVMVGYLAVAEKCDDPTSPFYHWTSGFGDEKAFNLAELDRDEACALLDRLEQPPLGLRWDSTREREWARFLILEHSYRIPWVIQAMCNRLVLLLDKERRAVLRVDDVRRVAETSQPVLEHLDDTPFDLVAGRAGEVAALKTGQALVAVLGYDRYFRGSAPIHDPHLAQQDPHFYAFTADDGQELLLREVRELFGLTGERERVVAYLDRFPYDKFLKNLCLTLFLLPAGSREGERKYCFRNHIFPRELLVASKRGRGVRDRIHNALLSLYSALPSSGEKP